jgi:hypothetical protein
VALPPHSIPAFGQQWSMNPGRTVFSQLMAIIRKRLGLELSLYQILQILSITLLEKMPISCVLEAFDSHSELLDNPNQLILFEF